MSKEEQPWPAPFVAATIGMGAVAASTLALATLCFLQNKQRKRERLAFVDVESMVFGIAIGDAAGVGLEFQSREHIREIFDESIERGEYLNLRTGAWGEGFEPGMYSDDTEMSLGSMEALIKEGSKLSEETLLDCWHNEWKEFLEERGYPRNGHGSIKGYYLQECTLEDIQKRQGEKTHPGNAPAMRAIPFAFVSDDHLRRKLAIVNADLTHPHPHARAASIVITEAARFIFSGGRFTQLISHCIPHIKEECQDTFEYLQKVDALDDYHLLLSGGKDLVDWELLCGPQPIEHSRLTINGLPCSSMHTAGIVLYLLKYFNGSTLDLLKNAVKVGGDVDSLASICLGIACGRCGIGDLPLWMTTKLEGSTGKLQGVSARFEKRFCTE